MPCSGCMGTAPALLGQPSLRVQCVLGPACCTPIACCITNTVVGGRSILSYFSETCVSCLIREATRIFIFCGWGRVSSSGSWSNSGLCKCNTCSLHFICSLWLKVYFHFAFLGATLSGAQGPCYAGDGTGTWHMLGMSSTTWAIFPMWIWSLYMESHTHLIWPFMVLSVRYLKSVQNLGGGRGESVGNFKWLTCRLYECVDM